jgi:hypothetical protein
MKKLNACKIGDIKIDFTSPKESGINANALYGTVK